VRTIFEDLPGDLNGVLYVLQSSGSAGAKRCAVHDDGVAFDVTVKIEVRAVTGVEDGVVFKDDDSGFDSVQSGAAARKYGPAGSEGAMAAGFASVDGFVRNVPRAAMNNEGRLHRDEDGKGAVFCLEVAKRGFKEKRIDLRQESLMKEDD
jgi:hypothetical protein